MTLSANDQALSKTLNPAVQPLLIALEVVCRLNHIPVDSRTIIQKYTLTESTATADTLHRILSDMGFRVKQKHASLASLLQKSYPFPLVLFGQNRVEDVVIEYHQEKLLLFSPHLQQTHTKELTDFSEITHVLIAIPKKLSPKIQFGFSWFWIELLNYRLILVEVLLGSFMLQLFGLITPVFTQVILDKVVVHRTMSTLNVITTAFIIVALFDSSINFARQYLFTHTSCKLDAKLGSKLFKHLFALPYAYFEARKVGTIVARVRELDTLREFLTNKAVTLVVDVLFSTVFFAMMLVYSWKLALVAGGFITLLSLVYLTITPTFRKRLQEKFIMGAQSNAFLVEAVTGIQTVKAISIEGHILKRWEDALADYIKSGFKLSIMGQWAGSISGLLQKGLTLAILYFGVQQVIANQLTIGQLIAFQMFSNQLMQPVLRLTQLWNEFQQALLSIERLTDILNHPTEQTQDKAITVPKLTGELLIQEVSFRYQPDKPWALHQLNLYVPPNSSIGIVGSSGSGKSTITKLIQRLYCSQEGAIYIDGLDTRHMDPVWLRQQIGVVLQENTLFSGTIRENIAMAQPAAPIELIIEMANMAGAHEFISRMPEGYDTEVGERGCSLSGGQKQRIAIARALITKPTLLIFDEATSALDVESEAEIQKNMSKIKQQRTMIIVAHRLATIRHCDQIAVLEKGQLIECGTHETLIKQKGAYYRMVETQASIHATC